MRQSIAAITTLVVCASCGGSPARPGGEGSTNSPLPASATFSRPPIDVSVISIITPIGNLNPPDHTLPTNHAYFFHPAEPNAEVRALSAGTIRIVSRGSGGNDDQVTIAASSQVQYYLAHILLDPAIAQNQQVTAGQRLGVTAASGGAMDLGLINDSITLFFVRPERYIPGTLHADSPLKYFDEPVRSQLYAKVTAKDRDGKINFDQAGRLAGNWFVSDLAADATENFGNGVKHLAFVRDVNNPDLVRISIGGSLSMSGAYYVRPGDPDPADVTIDSGPVSYLLLLNPAATLPAGTLLVQMTAANRIRVQAFTSGTPAPLSFSDSSIIYVR